MALARVRAGGDLFLRSCCGEARLRRAFLFVLRWQNGARRRLDFVRRAFDLRAGRRRAQTPRGRPLVVLLAAFFDFLGALVDLMVCGFLNLILREGVALRLVLVKTRPRRVPSGRRLLSGCGRHRPTSSSPPRVAHVSSPGPARHPPPRWSSTNTGGAGTPGTRPPAPSSRSRGLA